MTVLVGGWEPCGGVSLEEDAVNSIAREVVERGFDFIHSGRTIVVASRMDDGTIEVLDCVVLRRKVMRNP